MSEVVDTFEPSEASSTQKPRAVEPKPVPQIGCAKGTVVIPASFFEPLPEDLLRAFEGLDD
jgi:hypothetical protein